jgi:hypothetical protein
MTLRLKDIPFNLHASDIAKHVINIDSRFREQNEMSSSSKFYYRLLTPIRNVVRIRITSIELPNNYHLFSSYRRNVAFFLSFGSPLVTYTIRIPDGNYSASDMVITLNNIIGTVAGWLSVSFDFNQGTFTFRGTGSNPFTINTICSGDLTYDRPFDYGLGYNLGFSRGIFDSNVVGMVNEVVSDRMAMFAGDPYMFLKINNFDCIRQTTGDNDFTALAKIIVREPKDYMTFDDYASQQAKEVTFPAPYDLTRFKIQLLDPYGNQVDMETTNFSFSMEVLEVRNLSLYNLIRDAFATKWTM